MNTSRAIVFATIVLMFGATMRLHKETNTAYVSRAATGRIAHLNFSFGGGALV